MGALHWERLYDVSRPSMKEGCDGLMMSVLDNVRGIMAHISHTGSFISSHFNQLPLQIILSTWWDGGMLLLLCCIIKYTKGKKWMEITFKYWWSISSSLGIIFGCVDRPLNNNFKKCHLYQNKWCRGLLLLWGVGSGGTNHTLNLKIVTQSINFPGTYSFFQNLCSSFKVFF